MPRLLKLSALTLFVLVGAWLAISGVYSFCATRIGGMYVTTMDDCFFIPDIGGWIGRVWHAGIAMFGLVLGWRGAGSLFAAMRLGQPCACASGRKYRDCCFRRERGILVIGILTAIALLIFRALDDSLAPMIGILVSAVSACWLVGYHYRRRQNAKRV